MRVALIAVVAVAGCVSTEPMVGDYNGHMAKIIYHPYALGDGWRGSPTYAKAKEACGRDAVYHGTRQINEYQGEHVYLCK